MTHGVSGRGGRSRDSVWPVWTPWFPIDRGPVARSPSDLLRARDAETTNDLRGSAVRQGATPRPRLRNPANAPRAKNAKHLTFCVSFRAARAVQLTSKGSCQMCCWELQRGIGVRLDDLTPTLMLARSKEVEKRCPHAPRKAPTMAQGSATRTHKLEAAECGGRSGPQLRQASLRRGTRTTQTDPKVVKSTTQRRPLGAFAWRRNRASGTMRSWW